MADDPRLLDRVQEKAHDYRGAYSFRLEESDYQRKVGIAIRNDVGEWLAVLICEHEPDYLIDNALAMLMAWRNGENVGTPRSCAAGGTLTGNECGASFDWRTRK